MTDLPHVFVTRRLPGDALTGLDGICDVDLWEHDTPPPKEILWERSANADGLLCLLTDPVDGPLMDACPYLQVVANMAVGYDNIDLEAAATRGIAVGNTPDVLTDATADMTMALMLAAARRLPEGIAAVHDGTWGPWKPDWLMGLELRGAVLGIIGLGRIGRAVAERATAFGMTVIHHDPAGGGIELDEVLATADVVTLHCPLLPETRHLIDRTTLGQMKPGAILVNTSRGPVVDQAAVVEALHQGHLGAAALDVTDPEPLPPDDPLLAAPNVIVLPHLASATNLTRGRMAWLAVENIRAGVQGQPLPHPVTIAGGPITPTRPKVDHA